jgi:hypothetical protein
MNREQATPADVSALPTIEVRFGGQLLKRVAAGAAEQLIGRGWAQPIGTGRRRYLRLTESAPLSVLHSWRGCDGLYTRPLTGTRGQVLGDPAKLREFISMKKLK